MTRSDNLRTWVMIGPAGELIGFHAINAHAVTYSDLPTAFARNRPGHGSIPAAFIAMIGVDARYQGKGYGGDLLVDALSRIAAASEQLGLAVALLDVLDCGDPEKVARRSRIYRGFGFMPLPSNPSRLFLPIGTVRKLLTGDTE
nr:GNAT family N-acetyltransferase [Aurantimonas aggregata]